MPLTIITTTTIIIVIIDDAMDGVMMMVMMVMPTLYRKSPGTRPAVPAFPGLGILYLMDKFHSQSYWSHSGVT